MAAEARPAHRSTAPDSREPIRSEPTRRNHTHSHSLSALIFALLTTFAVREFALLCSRSFLLYPFVAFSLSLPFFFLRSSPLWPLGPFCCPVLPPAHTSS